MIIADMHCDSLLNVTSETGLLTEYNHSERYKHLQFFAHFVPSGNEPPEKRRRRLMNFFNIYLAETTRLGIKTVKSCHDLAWNEGRVLSLLSIEGGGGLFADSAELDLLYEHGLRVLGMAWDTNELCASAWDKNDTGLTDAGKALAIRASEMGIVLDVSHISDRSFYELHELIGYPMLATHSNFRAVTNSVRNLTDDMAKIIASRGGVIGLNLYPPFIGKDGGASKDDIIRHVDYALSLIGEDSIGFGFDIDGTDGKYPDGITEESSIHDTVCDILLQRYPSSTVEKIAGANVLRFLSENLE